VRPWVMKAEEEILRSKKRKAQERTKAPKVRQEIKKIQYQKAGAQLGNHLEKNK